MPAGTVTTHECPSLNKILPVATLSPSFLSEENQEPVPSMLQVDKEKPAASSLKITSEGFPETESSLLGQEKTARLKLLEPDKSSKEGKGQREQHSETAPPSHGIKEVAILTETEGKDQKAPSQRVQEGGKRATGRKGIQQKETEDAKKTPRPGYQGTAEEVPNVGKSRERDAPEEARGIPRGSCRRGH